MSKTTYGGDLGIRKTVMKGTWRWGRKQRRGGLSGWLFDLAWRVTSSWSITLEGTVTWWCADDVHHRERKLDYELRVPCILWRPYCWWRGGHDWYYKYCVFCESPFEEGKGLGDE